MPAIATPASRVGRKPKPSALERNESTSKELGGIALASWLLRASWVSH